MAGGLRPYMRRITVAAVAAALAAAAAAHAADQVANITNLKATPARFCAKLSDTCPHPGTTIHFTVSTPARVIGDIHPRSTPIGGYKELERRFPAGRNSFRLRDRRLTPGRWTLKLQPVNSVGASGPATINLRVVK
jgi:predicted transglutaminase-like cysteine proteinase